MLTGSWLIQKNNTGSTAKSNGDAKLPLHAAAKIFRQGVAFLEQSDITNCLVYVLLRFNISHLSVKAFQTREELDVLTHRQVGKEAVVLKTNANILSNRIHLFTDVFASNFCCAICWRHGSSQHVDNRCLSRSWQRRQNEVRIRSSRSLGNTLVVAVQFILTIVPQKGRDFSLIHVKIQAIDRPGLAKNFGQATNFDILSRF